MTLHATDGSTNVTLVDNSTYTGIYAADGSLNVVEVDGTDYTGIYASCGAMNVSSSPYVAGIHKITVLNPPE